MTTTTFPDPVLLDDVDALRERLDGDVVTPYDPTWNEARLAWNLAADQRPLAVVFAESAEDVAETIGFARIRGITVAPQGTGHFATARGSVDGSILLRTDRMRGVTIDPEAQVARAEAGVIWQEVSDAAIEHGLAALAGSAHDVGVVGYTLGGGMGWMARHYGLAANSVVAVELVTADGRLVRTDAETEPDLFWAVRGGGGSFGIVTAIEFRLYPVAEIYAGVLFWPVERAKEVLNAWREWIETTPREITSVGRILHFPPIPDLPEHLRGRSFVVVELAFVGSEADGAAHAAPLRALGPEMDTLAMILSSRLSEVHMDPPGPVPGLGDGGFLADLPADAIDAIVRNAGAGSGSPLLSVEVRQLGGALAEASPEHGVVGSIDAKFAYYSVGMAVTPEMASAVTAAAESLKAVLGEWLAERTYFNFAEGGAGGDELFGPAAHRRLREIKAAYDPDETFRVTHQITPAA